MIKRLRCHFRGFPVDEEAWPDIAESTGSAQVPFALEHNSRKRFYRVFRHGHRMIGNANAPQFRGWKRWRHAQVCRDRHAEPLCEMVHISALERLGVRPYGVAFAGRYQPQNLVAALDLIEATYRNPTMPASAG